MLQLLVLQLTMPNWSVSTTRLLSLIIT